MKKLPKKLRDCFKNPSQKHLVDNPLEVELLFIGEFTSNFNPLVGVVANREEALRVEREHTEDAVSWETIAVSDRNTPLEEGTPLWLLVQGGVFAETAFSNPSPVALYSTLEAAKSECAFRKEKFDEDLLIWQFHLGKIDFGAPDWTYLEE